MTGFKLRTTGIGSDHYTNCATTTTIVGKSVVTLRLPMLHHLTIPAYYTFVSICRNKVLRASLMSNLPLQLTLSVFIVVTVQSKFAEIWNHVLFSLTQVFVSFASLQNLSWDLLTHAKSFESLPQKFPKFYDIWIIFVNLWQSTTWG